MPGVLLMVLASVPMFVAAIVATQQSKGPSAAHDGPFEGPLPPDALISTDKVLAIMLWSSAIGAGAASCVARWELSCPVGFGGPCAVAAVVNSAAIIGFVVLAGRHEPSAASGRIALACLGVVACSYALTHAHRAVLAQAISRNATGVSLVAEAVWVPAVVLLMTAAGNLQHGHHLKVLATISLVLGAIGALMVVHKTAYSSKRPRLRRVAALSSLILMVFMLPGTVKRGAQHLLDNPPSVSLAPSVTRPDTTPATMSTMNGSKNAS